MDENIFELLEEWDIANVEGYNDSAKEIGRKIEALRNEYREKGTKAEKVKIVGVFAGRFCSVYMNDSCIAHIWHLRYRGIGSSMDNKRLYTNEDTHIWLDYAVYE